MYSNYYSVEAKFGHVGKHFYITKVVGVAAENAAHAAYLARWMPRVKHHDKTAIINVKEISKEAYDILTIKNGNDPYFTATSRSEEGDAHVDLYLNRIRVNENWDEHEHKEKTRKKAIKRRELIKEYLSEINELEYAFI